MKVCDPPAYLLGAAAKVDYRTARNFLDGRPVRSEAVREALAREARTLGLPFATPVAETRQRRAGL